MKTYIGITIGPIVETICETTKPAGLWFASSIFSDITRRLCREIKNELNGEILSPYYDQKDTFADGVGKYHDRIIFSVEEYHKDILDGIIEKVKHDTILNFPLDGTLEKETSFLMDYLQIKYVVLPESEMDGTNSLLTISPYLDAIELMKTIPDNQDDSPFGKLFFNKESNALIAKSEIFKEIDSSNNQFFVSNAKRTIRDIGLIAQGNDKANSLKRSDYFAVVSADGDGMGAFLQSLKSDQEVQLFSKACLRYAKEASKLVGDFGGMTIYAGGDDLLFLAPLTNAGENILSLCARINDLFQKIVGEEFLEKEKVDHIPTISFGITVHYKKYPLYEAFDNSRNYLAYVKNHTAKNAIALQVEKHSGQSMGIVIPNSQVEMVNQLLNREPIQNADGNQALAVQSVIYTLEDMQSILSVLDQQPLSEADYWNSWKNFFDNEAQQKSEGFHEFLCKWYYKHLKNMTAGLSSISEETVASMRLFTMLLRIDKFLREKKGNDE